MVESIADDMLMIKPDETRENCLRVFGGKEIVSGDDLGQLSIEPLEDAIGLWRARLDKAVLDAEGGGQTIELVIAAGIVLTAAK